MARVEMDEALDRLYREHGERLWRAVFAFAGDREVASDAVAEAFAQRLVGVVIDLEGRRILSRGEPLALSDLEFCVLGALAGRPGRAWWFKDLRSVGWGDQQEVATDVEGLRALVQRVRRKLADASAPITIEAVRGYGYRAVIQ